MKKFDVFFVITLLFALVCPSISSASSKLPADSRALQKMEGKYYYLAYNLHGDARLGKISSVNYQLQGGLIPWGTEVKILKIYRNFLMFVDKSSGKKWKYEFHYNSRQSEGLKEHIKSVFVEDPEPIRRKVALKIIKPGAVLLAGSEACSLDFSAAILACPRCQGRSWQPGQFQALCRNCGWQLALQDGIWRSSVSRSTRSGLS